MRVKRLERNPFSKLPIFGMCDRTDTESIVSEGAMTNKENDVRRSNSYIKDRINR